MPKHSNKPSEKPQATIIDLSKMFSRFECCLFLWVGEGF
jgi:hypothetical protein